MLKANIFFVNGFIKIDRVVSDSQTKYVGFHKFRQQLFLITVSYLITYDKLFNVT